MADNTDDSAAKERKPQRASLARLSKNKSVMAIIDNPFELAAENTGELHVDNINDAKFIGPEDFATIIIGPLKTTSDNQERISMLTGLRLPYLFNSAQLLTICNLTTSQRTQMRFIELISPRLIDPAAGSIPLSNLFRFNTEKEQVEKLLKDRGNSIKQSKYNLVGSPTPSPSSAAGAGAGTSLGRSPQPSPGSGRGNALLFGGGRGGAGRGRGIRSSLPNTRPASDKKPPRPTSLPTAMEDTVFKLHGLDIRTEEVPEGGDQFSDASVSPNHRTNNAATAADTRNMKPFS